MSNRKDERRLRHPLRRNVRRPRHPSARPTSRDTSVKTIEDFLASLPTRVSRDCLTKLLAYLDAMLLANQSLNLTGIREKEQAKLLHVLDSLQVGTLSQTPALILDLGSGNGFPGVAAACLWPDARVILVERTQKKARAISSCLQAAKIENAETRAIDAAQLPSLEPELLHCADLVLARALGALGPVVELATPFLARGAYLVQWKTDSIAVDELREYRLAVSRARLRCQEDISYRLPDPQLRRRRLLVAKRRSAKMQKE